MSLHLSPYYNGSYHLRVVNMCVTNWAAYETAVLLRKPTLYIEHQSIEPDVVFRTFVDTTRPGISTVEGLESMPETVQVGLS